MADSNMPSILDYIQSAVAARAGGGYRPRARVQGMPTAVNDVQIGDAVNTAPVGDPNRMINARTMAFGTPAMNTIQLTADAVNGAAQVARQFDPQGYYTVQPYLEHYSSMPVNNAPSLVDYLYNFNR